jgi:hypothetical protein
MNNRGQFTIIAALLVAIVLAGTLIAVYSTIRYDSSQTQTPQTLTATDETNSAILKALGFTVGYYGSILQVTGNQTYAYANATVYMNSALQYISSMNPSFGESINMTSLTLSNNWFSNPSVSTGTLSVVYDLADLGIYGVNYTTSCSLGAQIFNSPNINQVCLNVTQDLTEPLTSLGEQNFAFYFYNYSTSNWQLINPSLTPTTFTNGTYLINVPSGIKSSAYMVQVTDSRGITVEASSFNSYNINFTFSSQNSPAPVVVELLQNGTMLWSGQSLVNTTSVQPIPPVPVKSLQLCQTGSTSDILFQVEDWASGYQIPLGLTDNYTIFSNNQMVVFEVTPSLSQLTFWWNGSDTAVQPSAAYTDIYFTADNPPAGTLSNGNMTLQFSYPNSAFQIKSTVGSMSSTTNFMRIDADTSVYGSRSPAYVIQYGVVRDIVQEEAEWNNGPTNCPNVYSQIVFTFPSNATYFTYQLRLIFINSAAARNINDISPIQLTTSISQPQAMTENGITNGIPNVTNSNGYFNNSTGNAHHWSQLINNSSQGTGIMFTDSANQQLYAFDKMAGTFTGALYANSSVPVIELDPVTSEGSVNNFTSALDLTWYGFVSTFNGANPIYANNGTSGLWPIVEQPPSLTISPQSAAAPSINISPSSGPAGTSVTVSGGGFLPNSLITITYNGNTVATTTATSYGEIPLGTTVVISSSMPGSYTIAATDTSSDSASANFIIPPIETIAFQLGGIGSDSGASTILTIDSIHYTYSTLPSQFNWPAESTHTITASSTVAAGNGKQYSWSSWSDGGAQTHSYTVPTSNFTITVNYGIQWQVTFNQSGLDGTTAVGTVLTVNGTNVAYSGLPYTVWVNNGDRLVYSYNATVTSSTTGKQFVVGLVSPVSPLAGISSMQTVIGGYTTQYYLTTNSTSGSTNGSGWYNAGSSATISATPPNAGGGEQYVWNGWVGTGSGSYTGINNPATNAVTLNAAITETASWINQYQVTVTASPSGAIGGTFAVTYTMSGTTHTNEQHNAPWTQWIDASTTVTVSSPQNYYNGYTFSSYTNNPVTVNSNQTITLVYYGALDHLIFNAISSPQTSGSAFSVTVTAKDLYGTTVTNYTTTNTLSVSTGTINPTTTGAFSSGVWTGSVTVTGAGSGITISTSGSSKTGTSGTFNVTKAPPALDGSASTNTVNSNGQTRTMTMTLKTSNSNDVLYLSFVGGGSTDITSISSTGGTSAWAQRGYVQTEDSTHHLSTWYATWTSNGTTTITITLTNGGSTHCAAVAFGICGANITSPFDGNAKTNNNNSGSASVSITMTSANDFIVGSLGMGTTAAPTNGGGFTSIANQAASSSRETSDEYYLASGTGTYTPTYTFSSNYWGMIADAIKSS